VTPLIRHEVDVTRWLGIPWDAKGRTREAGWNCLRHAIAILREEAGLPVPDEDALLPGEVTPTFWLCWEVVSIQDLRDFDVLVVPGVGTHHVGVVVNGLRSVLTTMIDTGSVCLPHRMFCRAGVIGVYRWKGAA
jgi:hypothetical protein